MEGLDFATLGETANAVLHEKNLFTDEECVLIARAIAMAVFRNNEALEARLKEMERRRG